MEEKSATKHSKASTQKATPEKSGLHAVKKAKSEKTKKRKGRFSGPSPPYKLKNAEYRKILVPLQNATS